MNENESELLLRCSTRNGCVYSYGYVNIYINYGFFSLLFYEERQII